MNKNDTPKCALCGLIYRDKILAEKCEKFCKENNACSMKITKHALNKKEMKK